MVVLSVEHEGRVKCVQCAAGMDVEEMRKLLAAAFGIEGRVVGLVSPKGVTSPISFLCVSPSSFIGTFSLLVLKKVRSIKEVTNDDLKFRVDFGDEAFHLENFDFSEIRDAIGSDFLDFETYHERVRALTEDKRATTVFLRVWRALSELVENRLLPGSALLAGLSTLAKTESPEKKIFESFRLFDGNGDGVISKSEMHKYFLSVFLVQRERDPQTFVVDETPFALAKATADHAFDSADADHNGVLSFEEFRAWLQQTSSTEKEPTNWVVSTARNELFPEAEDVTARFIETKAESLYNEFFRASKDGVVSKSKVLAVLGDKASKLFDSFDPLKTGFANAAAVAAGTTALFCVDDNLKGTVPLPARVFLGGLFTKAALEAYLQCVFTALLSLSSDDNDKSSRMAAHVANACFKDLDTTKTDRVSASAFSEWWTRDVAKPKLSKGLILSATCCDAFTAKELYDIFRQSPPQSNFADTLTSCFLALRRAYAAKKGLNFGEEGDHKVFEAQGGKTIVHGLIDALFSAEETPSIFYVALGLSTLCQPTTQEDLFQLLQTNGFVTAETIRSYFTAPSRVERAIDDDDDYDVDAENTFVSSLVPKQGRLNKEQFFQWIKAPPQESPLQQVALDANLKNIDASTAVASLAEAADASGYLDKTAFVEALSSYDSEQVTAALASLFDLIRLKTSIDVHDVSSAQLKKKVHAPPPGVRAARY